MICRVFLLNYQLVIINLSIFKKILMIMSKIPTYLRIKNAITANIHAGIWASGSAIPAEMTLAEQFGVSRMTVNRALKELESERVLERRQGSGTFVAQQKYNHTFIEVRNIAKDIIDNQQSYRACVVAQSTLTAADLKDKQNQWLAEIFFQNKPSSTDKLYQVSITHYADDVPMQFEERWVNAAVVPDFLAQDFTQVNTSDYLIAHVPLESGEYKIMAKIAPPLVQQQLLMADNEPALLHTRQTHSRGQLVSMVNMWHAGSRHHFGGQL